MKDHQFSLLGTGLTWTFAVLGKLAMHFEAHSGTYAHLAAVLVGVVTIGDIVLRRFKKKGNQ